MNKTQLEYYSEVVLKNTSYYLGVDQNDFNEYSYPVKYGNLKFICAGDAANWTLLYALGQDSSDYAKKMAELIYEHRKDLEGTRVTFLTTDNCEIGYDESYITDWRENLKVDVDEKKAIEAFKGKKENNVINEYEIVS